MRMRQTLRGVSRRLRSARGFERDPSEFLIATRCRRTAPHDRSIEQSRQSLAHRRDSLGNLRRRPVFSGHTVCRAARVGARVSRHVRTYTRAVAAASVACRRGCKDRSVSPPPSPYHLPPITSFCLSPSPPSPSVSVAHPSPVFMRVSMGKGSATRTRRKIISDLPRARRSCRPPYIARRSVLRRIFEMETHPLSPTPAQSAAVAIVFRRFVRRNSKKGKKGRKGGRRGRVCSEIGCDRKKLDRLANSAVPRVRHADLYANKGTTASFSGLSRRRPRRRRTYAE